jgi:large conductance mechanosensitive channel
VEKPGFAPAFFLHVVTALPGQGVPSATSIDYFGRAPLPGQAQGDAQMSLASEFKEFAMRGNVIDLAVGVVIGGAFGKIVSSLVDSLVMPIVGAATSGVDLSELAANVGTEEVPVLIKYGAFMQAAIDFIIIAFVIFVALKGINKLKRPPEPAAPAVPPPPPREQVLPELLTPEPK